MMFWRGWTAALLLLLAGWCAPGPAGAVDGVGVANLVYEGGKPAALLSWQMDPSSLRYSRNDSGWVFARVVTEIHLYAQDSSLYNEQRFVTQTAPVRVEDLDLQHLLLQRRFGLRPGLNRVRIRMYQQDAPNEGWEFSDTLRVADPHPSGPFLSTLQLLDTFYASRQPSPFLHEGFQQIPKPFGFYADGQRRLSFFLEAYAAASADTALQPLVCRVGVVRKNDVRILANPLFLDTLRRPGNGPVALRGSLNLATLASGNYYLTAQLLDRNGLEVARQQRYFQMVNKSPEVPPADTAVKAMPDSASGTTPVDYLNLAETFVGKYKDDEIIAILRMLLPISTPEQKETIEGFFRRPEPVYSRYFIYNFFEERNKKRPEAAWKQYADKVREVNSLFAGRGGTAYTTDRGFIYLRYGKPNERIQAYNEGSALPYEIWSYNAAGPNGAPGKFLFYQPARMGGDFRLLHSSVRGEMYNPRWREQLYPNGNPNVNNSRAEQQLGF